MHSGVNGNAASFSYVIGTTCSASVTNFSDTISSMKVTVNNPNNGLAILNWNKIFSPTNKATASNWYKIYQEYPVGVWTLIDSTRYGTERYVDTITVCDDSINYRVSTENNGCSSISSVDGSTFKDILPPDPPSIKNVSVDNNTNNAIITWNKGYPFDTDAYIILQFISGSWQPIDTVYGINNTTYTNLSSQAGAASECYGIAAFDSCWYGVPLSPNTSAMGLSHCSILLQSTYDACNKSINLSWNAYSAWTTGNISYEIFEQINNAQPISLGVTTGLSFSINNVSPNTNNCYTIRAITDNLPDTAISSKICINTEYPYISDTNYIQTATVIDNNSIDLRIYTTPKNTIKGYNIERIDNNGIITEIGFAPNTTSPILFTDNSINTQLYSFAYRVIPVDSCNSITNKISNIAKTIFLSVSAQGYTNTLNWTNYSFWEGTTLNFNIYRQLGNTPPSLIATVSPSTLSYTDDISTFYSSSNDGKFCYFIEAIENINTYGIAENSTSNIACITPDQLIYVPNSFTPNDDGLNDIFQPIIGFANYTTYTMQIFNRLGHEIFKTNDINIGWDGKHQNEILQNNLYIYQILIENAEGKPLIKSGTVLKLN
ncbi:MAG: gliding motility-associated C-terminal domain-containing protein [Flavobacteriales bacterium]